MLESLFSDVLFAVRSYRSLQTRLGPDAAMSMAETALELLKSKHVQQAIDAAAATPERGGPKKTRKQIEDEFSSHVHLR